MRTELEQLVARINNYFQMGGVFNPEQMDHIKVRDLLKDCREFLAAPSEPQASSRCTCGHLVTGHYGPGNPCCFCHCEHFVPERDAPEPAKPQASEPQVQVSGPQCVKCG